MTTLDIINEQAERINDAYKSQSFNDWMDARNLFLNYCLGALTAELDYNADAADTRDQRLTAILEKGANDIIAKMK